ncbi:MAG: hypothetical protein K2K60_05575 [Clostridia bacterium]|nr:hypothetical protein [Clostridia bacterium]
MEKECCRCKFFKAYYSRAYCCYLREGFGRCSKKKDFVKKHESCPDWNYRKVSTNIKRGIVIKNLDTAITNISIIKDFLEERMEK